MLFFNAHQVPTVGVATAPEKSLRISANSAKYKWGWFPFLYGQVHLVKMHCAGGDLSDWSGSSLSTLSQTQTQLLCLFWQAARGRRIPQTTTDQQDYRWKASDLSAEIS